MVIFTLYTFSNIFLLDITYDEEWTHICSIEDINTILVFGKIIGSGRFGQVALGIIIIPVSPVIINLSQIQKPGWKS